MQTIEHPYTVGGGVQSNTLFPVSPGRHPLDQYKMDAMQNAMDDAEYSAYYGVGESAAQNSTLGGLGRAKQSGIRTLVVTNKVTSPTNAGEYKATDFQRDSSPRRGSRAASPTSSSCPRTGWTPSAPGATRSSSSWSVTRSSAAPSSTTTAPFLGDVTIVENSILPDFTAFSLTSPEARFRVKRPLIDEPFGKTGDNVKGHMIAELAIEIDNEGHHPWLENVTAFSS